MRKNIEYVIVLILALLIISCSNSQSNLSKAVKTGNIIEVRNSLNDGADINKKSGTFENSVLHDAVVTGNLNSVRFLVENGANINSQNNEGDTPLHFAIQNNKKLLIDYLIQSGADVNTKNNFGYPPLFLVAGADKNIEKEKILYSLNINKTIFEKIIESGANINSSDHDGNTLLHYATLENNINNVSYILSFNIDTNIVNNLEGTALHIAFQNESYDIAKLLIDHNADSKVKNAQGELPKPKIDILTAVKENDIETAKLYFDLGGSPEGAFDSFGLGLLHIAAKHGSYKIADMIIEYGGDVNSRNKSIYKDTPIIIAVQTNQIDIVKLLIEKGADINIVGSDKTSALMVASGGMDFNAEKRFEITKILLENGADIDLKDNKGKTALDYAYQKKASDIAALIESKKDPSLKKDYVYKAIRDIKPELLKIGNKNFKTNYEYNKANYDASLIESYGQVSSEVSYGEYFNRGMNYYNAGNYSSAASEFKKSIKAIINSKSYSYYKNLGRVFAWLGGAVQQDKQYNNAIKYYNYAIANYLNIKKQSGDSQLGDIASAAYNLGTNYYYLENWDDALENFEIAIYNYIKLENKKELNTAIDWYTNILDYKLNRYKEAADFYRAGIKISEQLGEYNRKTNFENDLKRIEKMGY